MEEVIEIEKQKHLDKYCGFCGSLVKKHLKCKNCLCLIHNTKGWRRARKDKYRCSCGDIHVEKGKNGYCTECNKL